MPPIGQQGSRGGLITAMVIFAILFLTSAIFAIYFNANMRQAENRIAEIQKKYQTVVKDDQIGPETETGSAVTKMREEEASVSDPSLRYVDVLTARADALGKLITGSPAPGFSAVQAAKTRLDSSKGLLEKAGVKGVELKPDNLLGSIEVLTSAIIAREQTAASTSAKLQQEVATSAEAVKRAQEGIAKAEEATKAAQAETENVRKAADADRQAKQAQVDQINAGIKTTIDDYTKQIEAKQVEITGLTTKVTDLEKQLDRIKVVLGNRRMDTKESTVRRTDGYITRVSDDGKSVWINRGSGDQISPGLSFEVYDRTDGVPPLGDGMREEDMPVGKGSIEVIAVGATSSECRIVKTTPGMTMSVGDPIANLVYDPNTKFNFVVYGKFDLDRNKVSTDQEADVIKRLVTQWGGKIVDKIDVDTDFVVLGTEPTIPAFTPEELQLPENVKKLGDATAEVEAYNKVRADAKDLHIPVMNQNRFLYFVGYYDQAKR